MNSRKEIIIISGPNGSGKTTISPYLLRDRYEIREYVNADAIALGLSAFDPDKAAFEAGRIMLKRLDFLAKQKVSFAFETTLSSRSYARWIKDLRKDGYKIHLLYLWLQSPELALERVKERVRLGGHNVEKEIIYRRYYNGIKNFFELYQQLANTWAVYDNSNSYQAELIAIGSQSIVDNINNSELWERFSNERKRTS